MHAYIFPKRILHTDNVKNADNLLNKQPLQVWLSEPNTVVMDAGESITFDFGKELAGGVRILTAYAGGEKKIRIRFGESLSETNAEIGEKGATNDHSTRDMTVELQSCSDMTFGQTGFRFVRIDILENTGIVLKCVVAKPQIFSKRALGTFKSDDTVINQIFDTAAYTLRLCLQNGRIWDGVKRDRLVWVGDMHPEILCLMCLYGNLTHVKNSLDFVKNSCPLPSWMNNIPTYSFWWMIILRDYYRQTGDIVYIRAQTEYIHGLLSQINDCVDENGTFSFSNCEKEMQYFIDWQTHNQADELAGVQALALLALGSIKQLLRTLEQSTRICDCIIAKVRKATYTVQKQKQISALRILAGIGNTNDEQLLLNGGATGMSTFMAYYILKAICLCGKYEYAFAVAKEYYGKMLDLGATSFWEDFNVDWAINTCAIDKLPKENQLDIHGDFGAFCYKGFRHSLCHGWSSGVLPYLIQEVAGIKILADGCKKIRIQPNLCSLQSLNVSYPTPYGVIKLECKKNGDLMQTKIVAPNEIEILQ